MPKYDPAEIEPRWQRFWESEATFRTPREVSGEKRYILDMFPYPSGEGLHVGHPEGYTATDILCRFYRMNGISVLHPMGFDAFGLPAEEHAIKTNTPPRDSTRRDIDNFRRQLKMLGFSYDWERELATTDVAYFRWTQWIFLLLFDTWFDDQQQKGRPISELPVPESIRSSGEDAIRRYQDEHRLAYQSEAPVNWCPGLGTVLANEEVIDGKSERGSHPVQRIPLRQWMLRITAYAERLEQDLEQVNWPEGVKKLQRDWIGRSTGAEIDFFINPADGSNKEAYEQWLASRANDGFPKRCDDSALRVYTTRPDTLFGATYMVIAPEHGLVKKLTTTEQEAAVEEYCRKASFKSDRERLEDKARKTGVFTGAHAVNPATGQPIPIWVADYVLATYGTGAIMAVPAHDTRDFEFARQFELPVIPVVDPAGHADVDAEQVMAGRACFTGKGQAINSGAYNGCETEAVQERIVKELAARGCATNAVNYKLRDWLFSRQRFWGEPFPILHELDDKGEPNGLLRPVDPQDLPVDLPHLEDYQPIGRPVPPLEKAGEDWLYPEIDGKRYKRETNTMPQWAGSCWYYLRFIDPANADSFVDPDLERQWMPVDVYIGGAEHAVLHLLYARFWHKVLYDRGHVSMAEPFQRLVNQGMILGEMEFTGYRDFDEKWVTSSDVIEDPDQKIPIRKTNGKKVLEIKLEPDQVEKQGEGFVLKSDPTIRVHSRAHKMSKSRGNVINPDAIVADYGADALRLYEMFMGPLEASKPWSMDGVKGVRSFLDRVWRMIVDDRSEELQLSPAVQDVEADSEASRILHKTIKAVTEDVHSLSFNTAIARMMEFVNFFTKSATRPRSAMEQFVLLLSPFAPHQAEELWRLLGHDDSLAYETWPKYDEACLAEDSIEVAVQIMGKVRSKIEVAPGTSKDQLETAAKADPRIAELLEGKQIRKVIVVPDRLVNFVAN